MDADLWSLLSSRAEIPGKVRFGSIPCSPDRLSAALTPVGAARGATRLSRTHAIGVGMRAPQHAAPLVVVRSEAESGRVGLRLIGELDLNTVALLEAELAGSREQSPPAVIDLSELRFLDLIGLRSLLRAAQVEGETATRLVGATGIVRRLIELTRALDDGIADADQAFAGEPTTRLSAETFDHDSSANGNSTATNGAAGANGNGNGNGRVAGTREDDAA
jgi:anti-anti-sigma factor